MSRSFLHRFAISFHNPIQHLPFELVRVPTQHLRADGFGLTAAQTPYVLLQRMTHELPNTLFGEIAAPSDVAKHGPRDIAEAERFYPGDIAPQHGPRFLIDAKPLDEVRLRGFGHSLLVQVLAVAAFLLTARSGHRLLLLSAPAPVLLESFPLPTLRLARFGTTVGLLGLAPVLFEQARELLFLRLALRRPRLFLVLLELARVLRVLRLTICLARLVHVLLQQTHVLRVLRALSRLSLFSSLVRGPQQYLAPRVQRFKEELVLDEREQVRIVRLGNVGHNERRLENVGAGKL